LPFWPNRLLSVIFSLFIPVLPNQQDFLFADKFARRQKMVQKSEEEKSAGVNQEMM
jgi:hypothetical protein